ncbi:MAG: AGE family epimerase/isomerase, partial [Planctomycetota bacterium]
AKVDEWSGVSRMKTKSMKKLVSILFTILCLSPLHAQTNGVAYCNSGLRVAGGVVVVITVSTNPIRGTSVVLPIGVEMCSEVTNNPLWHFDFGGFGSNVTVLPRLDMMASSGYMYAGPDHDSYGHDVEAAFLLLEAGAALKEGADAKTQAVARSLVDHALEHGWDAEYGGFYDKGGASTPAFGLDKVWWTQAEGLNALLLMHEQFGRATPKYFEAFLKQWEFIWKYQADHKNGEWYDTVSREGKPVPGQAKGQIWKAAYHNGRALVNVTEALRRLGEK